MLVTATIERLAVPSSDERQAILDGPVTPQAFAAAFDRLDALHAIEKRAPPRATTARDAARIVFWNAERLKYLAPSAALLRQLDADAILLCEVDIGMARSGNRHTIAELAAALEAGYLFGTEFIELDLGDARERAWHRGEANAAGVHGGAILSRHPLGRPTMLRLDVAGRWFDGAFGERRVGGRIAVMAELALGSVPVLLVAVHFESYSDPADRLEATRVLLHAIDAHAPGQPVLLGGDFNSSSLATSLSVAAKRDPAGVAAALAEDSRRLIDPIRHEPMFAHLRERGYDWTHCNLPLAVTQRTRPDGTPSPPFGKIDWLFARGLACSAPAILPAIDAAGVAISDHEALAVTIRPAARPR
jgi:endonuclease/exonuclease/phosphatase family metal-dependent hydrolase